MLTRYYDTILLLTIIYGIDNSCPSRNVFLKKGKCGM